MQQNRTWETWERYNLIKRLHSSQNIIWIWCLYDWYEGSILSQQVCLQITPSSGCIVQNKQFSFTRFWADSRDNKDYVSRWSGLITVRNRRFYSGEQEVYQVCFFFGVFYFLMKSIQLTCTHYLHLKVNRVQSGSATEFMSPLCRLFDSW